MALLAHALVDLEALETNLNIQGPSQTANLEGAINRATEWLETETKRQFVSRGEATEYHTTDGSIRTLQTQQWPIVSITTIHESTESPRVYDATTLLTAGTDYQAVNESGKIRRLEDSELTTWERGYRSAQIVGEFGYQSNAGTPAGADVVPADLALLCLFVAASIFKESDRSRWGVSSVTDSQGSLTRFLGYLPPDMKRHLDFYTRGMEVGQTWEAA